MNHLLFLAHVVIVGCIFYLMAAGAKFFVKLRGVVDFSYVALIVFSAYAGSLMNIHRGWNIFACIAGSYLLCILFTFLVLYLSSRLSDLYFTIGTFAFYGLVYQLALNMDGVTGGAFGLSSMQRTLPFSLSIESLPSFLLFIVICVAIIVALMIVFKKTYLFYILRGRGEDAPVIQSLGVIPNHYKFIMILVTTFLATLGGNMFAFYYLFIDPATFWIPLLIPLLMIVFGSYKFGDIATLLFSIFIMGLFDYLRFFKVVDPKFLGYFREIVVSLLVMIVACWIFRTTHFVRKA